MRAILFLFFTISISAPMAEAAPIPLLGKAVSGLVNVVKDIFDGPDKKVAYSPPAYQTAYNPMIGGRQPVSTAYAPVRQATPTNPTAAFQNWISSLKRMGTDPLPQLMPVLKTADITSVTVGNTQRPVV